MHNIDSIRCRVISSLKEKYSILNLNLNPFLFFFRLLFFFLFFFTLFGFFLLFFFLFFPFWLLRLLYQSLGNCESDDSSFIRISDSGWLKRCLFLAWFRNWIYILFNNVWWYRDQSYFLCYLIQSCSAWYLYTFWQFLRKDRKQSIKAHIKYLSLNSKHIACSSLLCPYFLNLNTQCLFQLCLSFLWYFSNRFIA